MVLLEDHALPLVAVSLWVGCGSKDEVESSAGYAHYLEHLIQRGTDASGPFEYTRKAQRFGGALSVRANYDRTAITLSGVPESLDDMVQAAASMALRATLKSSEVDLELGSLTQEIRTYYDLPSSVSLFEGMRAGFPGHPYRFPTLGNFRSVGTLKAEPITAFYRNLYAPNNMAIALTGDFEPKGAMARVEAAFGSAPKSATLPARPAAPNAFPGHTDVEKKLDFSESWTSLVFTGPGFRHPDRPAFEALAVALADSSSPVPLAATRDQNGTLSQASFYGLEDAGLLYIAVNPATPQLSYAAAASTLRAVVAFRATGFTDAQARDLTARMLRDERQRAAIATERAEKLAEATLFGGVRYYWDRPLVLGRLTAADLNRVAAKYLIPDNCRLVVLVPKETPPFSDESKAAFHQVFDTLKGPENPVPPGLDANLYPPVDASRVDPAAWGKGGSAPLGAPRRTVLKNGLTLLVLEDHRLPSAAVSVHLKGGSGTDEPGKEGRAGLLLRILGTRTAQALRDRPAPAGAKRPAILPEAQTGRDLLELRFTGDPGDVAAGLEALARSLKEGVAGADLERVRQAALQNLARAEQRADVVGLDLFHEKVYAGHPYAQRPDGTTAGVQAVTTADLQAIAPAILDPSQCVVAVAGDVDAAETARTVERLFGPWKSSGKRPAEARPSAAATAPAKEGAETAPVPEAPVFPATSGAQPGEYNRQIATPQSLAIVGVPGVPLLDGDFPLLRTLGAAVTLFGFEEMVFTRRAAFGVTGSPEGYRDGGALTFEATAQHTRRGEAVFELQRLMRRLALEDLSDGDRRDLARMQAGRAAAAAQGAQPLASLLAYREASGLSASDWRTDVTAGTPPSAAALRALAERLFQTERSIRVVVGPPSP